MRTTIKSFLLLSLLSVLLAACREKENKVKTICNPVNLSYRFSLDSPSWREAADPSMIKYKGEYYLFLSKSGGYFHSTDLVHWDLITTDSLPIEKYAPTVMEMNGEIYFTASVATNKIYKSADPKSGKWELVTDQFPYILADPMLFYDSDTDKVYLYYGSGAATPMMGMELDKKTFMPKGEAIPLFYSNAEKYGWEVSGDYNTNYKHTSKVTATEFTYRKIHWAHSLYSNIILSLINPKVLSTEPDMAAHFRIYMETTGISVLPQSHEGTCSKEGFPYIQPSLTKMEMFMHTQHGETIL